MSGGGHQLWQHSRDRLATWLPALLMMLFAMGTWWLVRSAPKPPDTSAVRQLAAGEPDYFMRGFSMREFDGSGQLRSQLTGEEGQHYPASSTLDVREPRLRFVDKQGRLSTASARRAEARDDGSEVRLLGNARVERQASRAASGSEQPRLSFEGEYLQAFIDAERVRSDQPVRLQRGADVFTADSLDYDDKTGVARLQGRVRGVIQPAAKASRAAAP